MRRLFSRGYCAWSRGPAGLLRDSIASGALSPDASQQQAVEVLQALYLQLEAGVPPLQQPLGGIYLHGPVGSGKTVLMDSLVRSAPCPVQRYHFAELMKHVHEQMHRGRRPPEIGADLGGRRTLVALDELELTDIADAAIVSRLLDGILSSGAALVTTSNSEPDDLYPGGLNRDLYIPMLVKTLSQHRVMPQLVRPAGGDYRRKKAAASEEAAAASLARFFRPADQRAAAALGAAVAELGRAKETMDEVVPLPGRRALRVPLSSGGAACFSFEELCGQPLASADYLALASRFHTLCVHGVPPLRSPDGGAPSNAARRFVMLIDVWYDQHRRLLLSSDAALDDLFGCEPQRQVRDDHYSHLAGSTATAVHGEGGSSSGWATTFLAGGVEWSATGLQGASLAALSSTHVHDLGRRRAASRLAEMLLSASYEAACRERTANSGPTSDLNS